MNRLPKVAVVTLILFFAALALIWPYVFGQREAEKDYRKIQEDGSDDTLKEDFHAQNALFRGLVIAVVSGMVFSLLLYQYRVGILLLPAYFLYASALFGFSFTTNLNTRRGLHPWYVSRDPRASNTDRFFVAGSWKWNRFLVWIYKKTTIRLKGWAANPKSFSRLLHTGFVGVTVVILLVILVVSL